MAVGRFPPTLKYPCRGRCIAAVPDGMCRLAIGTFSTDRDIVGVEATFMACTPREDPRPEASEGPPEGICLNLRSMP